MKKILLISFCLVVGLVCCSCQKTEQVAQLERSYIGGRNEIVWEGKSYLATPKNVWTPSDRDMTKAGYVMEGDEESSVYTFDSDEEKLVLLKKADGIGTVETYFYLEDYNWPKLEEADQIEFVGSSDLQGDLNSVVDDPQVVDDVLQLFKPSKNENSGVFDAFLGDLQIYDKDLREKGFEGLWAVVGVNGDSYYMNYRLPQSPDKLQTEEISQELLERIVGKTIPTPQELRDVRAAAG